MVRSGAQVTRSARRRRRRWLVVIGVAVLLLLGTSYAVLRVKFEGPDLGSNIASLLNKKMRGRIAIGSIEWAPAALKTVVTGGWVHLTVRDVAVWDDCALSASVTVEVDELRTGDPNADCTPDDKPDTDPHSRRKPRKLLLRSPLIEADVDVHALMFGNHDFVFKNLWVHGGEALLEETTEPYPLHAYDRVIVSIMSAFYPRMTAGFYAGLFADTAPPIFDLRDIHVENLSLTLHMRPYQVAGVDRIGYGFAGRLEGVNIDADPDPAKRTNDSYVYMDPTNPLVAKFYVRLSITGERGAIRIRDEGPRTSFRLPDGYPRLLNVANAPSASSEVYPPKGRVALYELALEDIHLDRLAQMPSEWAKKNYVANTLELDLRAKTIPCVVPFDPLTMRAPEPPAKPGDEADIHLSGELDNYWDRPYDGSWNLKLDAKNLGPTIHTCIKDAVTGEHLDGTVTMTGPFVASPKIGFDLANVDFAVSLSKEQEPLQLTLAELHGAIDMVNEQGYLEKTKALVRNGKEPGEIELSATFGLSPYNANAQVDIIKPIDMGRFLPERVRPIGKFLKGHLTARGDNAVESEDPTGFALEDFDLSLGATERDSQLRVHGGRIFTPNNFGSIQIDNVMIEAGKSHMIVKGIIDLVAQEVQNLRLEGTFPDLGVWLRRFGLPAFVESAGSGVVVVSGPIKNLKIDVGADLGGVPCLDKMRVDATVHDNIVDIRRISSGGLGGELTGSGRINKGGSVPVIEQLHLAGRGLEVARMCGLAGTAKGTIQTLEADLRNAPIIKGRAALDWLDDAQVLAKSAKLTVKGDVYADVALCVNRKDDAACRPTTSYLDDDDLQQCSDAKKAGGSCIVASAKRSAGGVFNATIAKLPAVRGTRQQAAKPERIGGSIGADLPLAALEPYIGTGITGGDTHLSLHLAGTPDAPQASGNIQLLRTWVADQFVGDSQIAITPAKLADGKPALAFSGRMLADRVMIDGVLGTTGTMPIEVEVGMHRVEVDTAKDLTALLKLPEPVQAWTSGRVTVKTELLPPKPVEPEAWIELSELTAIVSHRGADGRITPLRLGVIDQAPGARAPVSLRVTPTSLELACKDPSAPGGRAPCTTQLATPAGVIELSGHATEASMAIEAKGTLDLSLIAPLIDTRFDEASGRMKLSASVAGTLAHPTYEAAIDLDPNNPVRLRPVGGDTVLEAPKGLIKLANGSLGFTDVLMQVRDQHINEKGELHVKGNIKLDGLTPANWSVLISGKLAGQMLLIAVPDLVSQAGGLATIDGDLILSGTGVLPQISGTLVFDQPAVQAGQRVRSIALIPRGVRRELAFNHGSIDIETQASGEHRTYTLDINDVRGSIDGEGTLSAINGRIELHDGELTSLRVGLDADNIPMRIPGKLDLVLSARNVEFEKGGPSSNLQISGNVAIIDGAYLQNFELTDQIRSIGTATAPVRPFWEEYPTLGSAELHLGLDVRRFSVKNNIATIDLVGPLIEITNTPRDPRLSGSIRIQRGEFRITGTRAKFTRTSGSIDFAENQKAGDPVLNVVSEAPDFRDLSGQEHLITLTISGTLSSPTWDLKTSTGYNKSQTLSLLVLGRNQESLRRSLGDQALGADQTNQDPSTNPSQGVADQIVKDIAGDWVSDLLGDSLAKFTGLDVLRLEIGFGSIGLRFEKNILDNLKLVGDGEQTIRGATVNVRAEFKTKHNISLQGGYLNKNFNDPAEQDINDKSVSIKTSIPFIP